MKYLQTSEITSEIAQAILKGERDYAETLAGMSLVRTEKSDVVHVDILKENQKHGYQYLERRLRDCA